MLYVLISIVLIALALIIFFIVRKANANKKIKAKFIEKGYVLANEKDPDATFIFVKDDKKYLVKVLYNYASAEININSKNYFQVNKGVVSSRKKGEKMKDVYGLINKNVDKNTKKIYVVYPKASRLLLILNECEMDFIDSDTNVYGCQFLEYEKM